MSSPDAPGNISVDRLNRCLLRLVREWNISEHELPRIVLFHVSRKAAEAAFVNQDVAVRKNTASNVGKEYYEVWLVGQPDLKYVLALQNVLEHHFRMEITDKQRDEVLARVTRMEDATISVSEGK